MTGRRGFLRSVAVGSTACLVGCDVASATPPMDDGGVGCNLPAPRPPPELDYPPPSYFEQVASDLDAAGIGTAVVFIDMDRVDANIDAIVEGIGPSSFRIVEKSLPSLDLLSYVSSRSGSERFMVLHLPFLLDLLGRFPSAEVLVGKCHLTSAVRAFLESVPASDRGAVASRVTFLADDPTQLDELVALAIDLGITLRLALELDVGLGRSGVRETSELETMLDVFLGTTAVRFAGFLGYDGHIAHSPTGTVAAMEESWELATARYRAFVDVLNGPRYDALSSLPDLVFNGGGTSSYPMYAGRDTPVNDVATGGGVLRPGSYPDLVISALKPAIFIATPVLQQYDSPQIPFFTPAQSAGIVEGRQGLTIQGGGWPAFFTYPADIRPAPLVSDATDLIMVPNQGLVTAPPGLSIGPGDWVFYHPRQSDVLFQFERVAQVRGGRLQSETMAAYPRRY